MKSSGVAKEVVFNNVLTLSFIWFPLTGFTVSIVLFYLYAEYGFNYLGVWGLIFTGFIVLFIMNLLLKYFSKNIRLYFTGNDMDIEINGQLQKIQKQDVVGLFAPDYENSKSSLISLQLCFKNGNKLDITDSKFTEKYDVGVNEVLKKDLRFILDELGFIKIRQSKSRAFKKQGAYWYAVG
ncbi:hypothetical protein [Mucilaginibacter glaciei]|uniref:Uncharacterized protein n=1 Tax=Mucilaginibacter glaciei TaxID=2772109 RepID=A0A926S0F1_9SPHI|nr:hypothetical protein [Mucilaginibacter glaciei]MBD1391662.1 hypothetical protein [Mucilaginibacter glaciei]